VVNFEQTHNRASYQVANRQQGAATGSHMAIPKHDKHKDYVRYATHCLDMMPATTDQGVRAINREMAAEWLKLADAIAHPLKPMK
jgi:hypothetical protein